MVTPSSGCHSCHSRRDIVRHSAQHYPRYSRVVIRGLSVYRVPSTPGFLGQGPSCYWALSTYVAYKITDSIVNWKGGVNWLTTSPPETRNHQCETSDDCGGGTSLRSPGLPPPSSRREKSGRSRTRRHRTHPSTTPTHCPACRKAPRHSAIWLCSTFLSLPAPSAQKRNRCRCSTRR